MPFESIRAALGLLDPCKRAKGYSDQVWKLQQQEGPDQEV